MSEITFLESAEAEINERVRTRIVLQLQESGVAVNRAGLSSSYAEWRGRQTPKFQANPATSFDDEVWVSLLNNPFRELNNNPALRAVLPSFLYPNFGLQVAQFRLYVDASGPLPSEVMTDAIRAGRRKKGVRLADWVAKFGQVYPETWAVLTKAYQIEKPEGPQTDQAIFNWFAHYLSARTRVQVISIEDDVKRSLRTGTELPNKYSSLVAEIAAALESPRSPGAGSRPSSQAPLGPAL